MKRYYSHAEISQDCIATHGEKEVLYVAADTLMGVFGELQKRFENTENSSGRIVVSIGWDDKQPEAARTQCAAVNPDDFDFKKYTKLPVTIEAAKLDRQITIKTLEGDMVGNEGDWLIRGVNGELYPCKPDIFAKTYKPAEAE